MSLYEDVRKVLVDYQNQLKERELKDFHATVKEKLILVAKAGCGTCEFCFESLAAAKLAQEYLKGEGFWNAEVGEIIADNRKVHRVKVSFK